MKKSEQEKLPIWQTALILIAIFACCGLPLVLVAASSLAIYSIFKSTNVAIIIAALALFAFALYGIRLRRKKKQ